MGVKAYDPKELQANPAQEAADAPRGNPGFFGPIQDSYDDAVARPPQEDLDADGPVGRGLAHFGRGVMELAEPVMHPIKTAMALPRALVGPHGNGLVDSILTGGVEDAKQHGVLEALEHGAGQVAGGVIAGEFPKMGAPIERSGLSVVNSALGAKGPKMFQYGQNAARGAIDEGVVPAMSKHSASMAVDPAMNRVGGDIATKIGLSQATIPTRLLKDSIESPIAEKRAVMNGPGGNGATEPLDVMQQGMSGQAPGATTPIYGPGATMGPGGIRPNDLWKTIQNIDKNTRFNPDPEVEGMNEVRRGVRGGLSGNLKDAIPEVKEPMQSYSDLSAARDALDRTMHSGISLKRFLDTAAFPLETTGGAAMVNMGRGLGKINPRFLQAMPVAGMTKENR